MPAPTRAPLACALPRPSVTSSRGDDAPLRLSTIRIARDLAAPRGQRFCEVFADSLAGDLARLEIRRKLRRALPGVEGEIIETLIEDLLTP